MRRTILALIPLLAGTAGAQIVPRGGLRFQQPTAWASFSIGLTQPWSVRDGSTQSVWQFSDATQYGVSLEKNLTNGASLGLRGSMSRVPLRYTGDGTSIVSTDADANVSQVMALVHLASGREFHSVLELSLGATLYSNFRERSTGTKLGPPSMDPDFSFGFGYGLGYAFSNTFSIDVVQDLTTALHQTTGLSAGEGSSTRINSTRLVARFGLGGR